MKCCYNPNNILFTYTRVTYPQYVTSHSRSPIVPLVAILETGHLTAQAVLQRLEGGLLQTFCMQAHRRVEYTLLLMNRPQLWVK